jgi:hypothetical protein
LRSNRSLLIVLIHKAVIRNGGVFPTGRIDSFRPTQIDQSMFEFMAGVLFPRIKLVRSTLNDINFLGGGIERIKIVIISSWDYSIDRANPIL